MKNEQRVREALLILAISSISGKTTTIELNNIKVVALTYANSIFMLHHETVLEYAARHLCYFSRT